MALTNQHAIAVNIVLAFLGITDESIEREPVDPEVLEAALFGLADAAEAKMHAGVSGDDVARCMPSVLDRRRGQDSDGAAQAVCRALVKPLGAPIPYPVRPHLQRWLEIKSQQAESLGSGGEQ